jgi:predicted nucleic acid-binding protein
LIYFDSSALPKFVKREKESEALRRWRGQLSAGEELVTSELAELEITRTLLRAGVDHQRVPYVTGQALRGSTLSMSPAPSLARAKAYGIRKLGSLGAVHLATADPFLTELTDFVTYDNELALAATEIGFPVNAPS